MVDGIDPKAKVKQGRSGEFTLKEALESYFEIKKDLRKSTKYDYEKTIYRYFDEWLNKPLKNINRNMVLERHKEIQKQVAKNAKSHMAKGHHAANSAMVVLRLLWNHASVLTPGLPDNPVSGISQLRAWYKERRRDRVLKASELPDFYRAVLGLENEVQRDLVLLMMFTGLRSQEARELKWEEIDFKNKLILIPSTRTKSDRKLDLPMSDFIYKLLRKRNSIGITGKWVFPSTSRSGHIVEVKYPFELIEKETGIHITPHDLRRTFITIAESCNIPIFALKGLVNHSMGTDVTAGYVVASPDRLRKPMMQVTKKIKELVGI
jgi:integrase